MYQKVKWGIHASKNYHHVTTLCFIRLQQQVSVFSPFIIVDCSGCAAASSCDSHCSTACCCFIKPWQHCVPICSVPVVQSLTSIDYPSRFPGINSMSVHIKLLDCLAQVPPEEELNQLLSCMHLKLPNNTILTQWDFLNRACVLVFTWHRQTMLQACKQDFELIELSHLTS